jgi:hypothetical protein
MPYTITTGLSACNGYAVVKDEDDEIMGCHKSQLQAERQMAALYAAEDDTEDLSEDYEGPTHEMPDGTIMAVESHGNRKIAEEILASVSRAD